MKCVIVGFIKCGQKSLVKYLENQGHEVEQFECATNPLGVRMINKSYKDYQVYIITRDPIKRMWSQYEFLSEMFDYDMTFAQYLHLWQLHLIWFNENPVYHSNYAEHLPRWEELNPIILSFEEMIKDPKFPHVNKGKGNKMPKEDYDLAKDTLEAYQLVLQGKAKATGLSSITEGNNV
jgi:hypothetical protein